MGGGWWCLRVARCPAARHRSAEVSRLMHSKGSGGGMIVIVWWWGGFGRFLFEGVLPSTHLCVRPPTTLCVARMDMPEWLSVIRI